MIQTEQGKLTLEDKKDLAFQIKELEKKCEKSPGNMGLAIQLRKLRRQRDAR